MGIVIIVVLGIFVPFVTIVALPLRVSYLIWRGRWVTKVVGFLLLLPWAYLLVPILKHGYVTTTLYTAGPTVEPRNWLYLAVVWAAFEAFVVRAEHPSTLPPLAN